MITYTEQIEKSENLIKISDKLASLDEIANKHQNILANYRYTMFNLEQSINSIKDSADLKDIAQQLEKSYLALKEKESAYKVSIEGFNAEYTNLKDTITQKLEAYKKYILIRLDPYCAKESNIPQVLFYKGAKKSRQPFFDTFQDTWEKYCLKTIEIRPDKQGYSIIWRAIDIDYIEIAEDAQTVLEYMQKNL